MARTIQSVLNRVPAPKKTAAPNTSRGKEMIKWKPKPAKKPKKVNKAKRRCKPGVRALREIRRYQNTGELLIPKAPFKRLVRECLQDVKKGLFVTATAVAAVQEAAEAHLVMVLEHANLLAHHAHRVTVQPRDIELATLIRTGNVHDFVLGTGGAAPEPQQEHDATQPSLPESL